MPKVSPIVTAEALHCRACRTLDYCRDWKNQTNLTKNKYNDLTKNEFIGKHNQLSATEQLHFVGQTLPDLWKRFFLNEVAVIMKCNPD